jgi:hypothetical protein
MISPRADHPFHVSQLFIILDRTDILLDIFATGLEDGTYPRSSVELVSSSIFATNNNKTNIYDSSDTLPCVDSFPTFAFSSK